MNNLYLLFNFNNYFNRKLIRYDTLAQYKTAINNDYINIDNCVNFNPGDGISTSQIVNLGAYNIDLREPNYMLVCDEHNDIKQRWFVVDCERTRGGQFDCKLYRDVVAESWDILKSAPLFVEKAIVAESDPAIWNDEDIIVNQIKKTQTPLKDSFGVAWIVGYLSPDNLPKENYVTNDSNVSIISVPSLYSWEFYKYTQEGAITNYFDTQIGIVGTEGLLRSTAKRIWFSKSNYQGPQEIASTMNNGLRLNSNADEQGENLAEYMMNNGEELIDMYENDFDSTVINSIKSLDGVELYDESTQKYYKISLETGLDYLNWITHLSSELFNKISDILEVGNDLYPWIIDVNEAWIGSYRIKSKRVVTKIILTEISESMYRFKIPHNRRRLDDQPYSMFAMEYNQTNMRIARAISAQLSNGPLYDLQLLPYRPAFYISDLEKDVTPIMKGTSKVGEIHWCYKSSFERMLQWTETIDSLKLNNLTKNYRLCSPNWNGQFEFSASKNGGLTGFKVKCTYKPYQPFIQVMPTFDGLYGRSFEDGRGLICGGKFDLPQTSDAWATYERQNTNYNAIFNRNIESLEVQQKYQRIGDIASAVAGTIQGAGAGAAIGGGFGMQAGIAGTAVGGVASGIAGVADVVISDKLRAEQMDYTKDMYGLNLQNVKAQPSSLVGIGALTNANTIFPVLEVYECTEKEKQAVIDKITYNGMSVNRIGTINEFKDNTWSYNNGWNYIKGKLIRIDIPDTDWHFVNILKNEMNMGVFIKRGEA